MKTLKKTELCIHHSPDDLNRTDSTNIIWQTIPLTDMTQSCC